MTFTNETMHPEAYPLTEAVLAGGVGPDAPFYWPLQEWQQAQGMGDAATADLYSLIAESFEKVAIHSINRDRMVSMMSRVLWINKQRYPYGH